MTRVRLLLAAFGLAALSLVAPAAMAHGGHAHDPSLAVPSLAVPSPCPADEGGMCCCHGDRCTNPSQPRTCAPPVPHARVQPPLSPERPRAAAHPIAVAPAHPVGAVGSRGPPVNSWR